MSDINIFEEGVKPTGEWIKLANVGDRFQGTYIGKFKSVDQKYHTEQIVYKFIKDRKLYFWGVRATKVPVHKQMSAVNPGQIVGVVFTKELAPEKGQNPTKIYEIFSKADAIEEGWEKLAAEYRGVGAYDPDSQDFEEDALAPAEDPFSSTPSAQPQVPTDDLLKEINMISRLKFLADSQEEIKQKVEEFTGLAFIPGNFPEILSKLK